MDREALDMSDHSAGHSSIPSITVPRQRHAHAFPREDGGVEDLLRVAAHGRLAQRMEVGVCLQSPQEVSRAAGHMRCRGRRRNLYVGWLPGQGCPQASAAPGPRVTDPCVPQIVAR